MATPTISISIECIPVEVGGIIASYLSGQSLLAMRLASKRLGKQASIVIRQLSNTLPTIGELIAYFNEAKDVGIPLNFVLLDAFSLLPLSLTFYQEWDGYSAHGMGILSKDVHTFEGMSIKEEHMRRSTEGKFYDPMTLLTVISRRRCLSPLARSVLVQYTKNVLKRVTNLSTQHLNKIWSGQIDDSVLSNFPPRTTELRELYMTAFIWMNNIHLANMGDTVISFEHKGYLEKFLLTLSHPDSMPDQLLTLDPPLTVTAIPFRRDIQAYIRRRLHEKVPLRIRILMLDGATIKYIRVLSSTVTNVESKTYHISDGDVTSITTLLNEQAIAEWLTAKQLGMVDPLTLIGMVRENGVSSVDTSLIAKEHLHRACSPQLQRLLKPETNVDNLPSHLIPKCLIVPHMKGVIPAQNLALIIGIWIGIESHATTDIKDYAKSKLSRVNKMVAVIQEYQRIYNSI